MSLPVITYTDSQGHIFDMMVDDVNAFESSNSNRYAGRISTAGFHNYAWTKNTFKLKYGDYITGWTKDSIEYQVTLLFDGGYDLRGQTLDFFHSAIDNDIMQETPGTLRWNDFTINCYIQSSYTHPSDSPSGYTADEIVIYCPIPWWTRSYSTDFFIQDLPDPETSEFSKDYEYDYEYDYMANPVRESILRNDSLYATNWEILLNGYAANPTIQIGNNVISLNLTVDEGEYLTISQREKTIFLTDRYGRKLNRFGYRDTSYYIFNKIEPGLNRIMWNGGYSWTLTLFEERSEPKWDS